MANNRAPVNIRGVDYPSMSEAARVLNVSTSTVFGARKRGTLDNVGLWPMKQSSILAWLAKAAPEDFPRLKLEAQRWFTYYHPKGRK